MAKFSIKCEIELSQEYKEYLLNLFAQGYFSEIWEQIILHNDLAIKLFIRELNELQYGFLGENIDLIV